MQAEKLICEQPLVVIHSDTVAYIEQYIDACRAMIANGDVKELWAELTIMINHLIASGNLPQMILVQYIFTIALLTIILVMLSGGKFNLGSRGDPVGVK